MNHRTTILALAIAASCSAQAATIGIDTVSLHLPQSAALSGINPGAYVRFDNGVTFGAYRNSFARPSLWAGYTAEYGPAALTVGVISGYQIKNQTAVVPCTAAQLAGGPVICTWTTHTGNTKGALGLLVAPSFALPSMFGVTPRVTILPKFGPKGHTVLHLSAEF